MKRSLSLILLLAIPAALWAQQSDEVVVARRTRIAKQSSTITGDRGLFTVPSVETLGRGQYSFGAAWINSDRSPRDIDINSVPVFFSYGLLGRLTVTGTFETYKQFVVRNPVQPGFNNSLPFARDQRFSSGVGDTMISAKYRWRRNRDNIGGISFRGFVKLNTADENKGLGSGRTDVGSDLLFTSLLPWFGGFTMQSSMGFTSTTDAKVPFEIGLKDEMRSGMGVTWPASGIPFPGGVIQAAVEYSSVTFVGAGTLNTVIQTPSDLSGGLRYLMLDRGITIDAAFRKNRNFDDSIGSKEFRAFIASVTYTRPVAARLQNNYPLIVLETSAQEVAAGGSVTITANGFDADNDTLAYVWSSTGGKVVGTGDHVTFETGGLTPGTYTVSAVANDGRGGTARSDVQLTVRP